jgi:hypothetical protein
VSGICDGILALSKFFLFFPGVPMPYDLTFNTNAVLFVSI